MKPLLRAYLPLTDDVIQTANTSTIFIRRYIDQAGTSDHRRDLVYRPHCLDYGMPSGHQATVTRRAHYA